MNTKEDVIKSIPHLEACINEMGCWNEIFIVMDKYAECVVKSYLKSKDDCIHDKYRFDLESDGKKMCWNCGKIY